MRYRAIALLAAGHLSVDILQGALPSVLPYLIQARHLNLALAGGILFASSVASSVVQPIFGHLADRLAKPWLMPVGLLLAGMSMAFIGTMSSYMGMLLVVAICGLGVAAFHPEGARLANANGGTRKATAMSLFSVGGNAGFALGPLLFIVLYRLCGLHGTLWLFIPPLVMAVALWAYSSHMAVPSSAPTSTRTADGASDDAWGPFARLSLIVICRSIVFYAMLTFIPQVWIHVLHRSTEAGSIALAIFTTCGILGTLFGGRLADRFGYLRVIRIEVILLAPIFVLFLLTHSVVAATALLALVALTYYSPFSAMVVLGQRYLPNHLGLASGVTLGLAVSIGGAMAPVLGHMADLHGIATTLQWVAVLPCVMIPLTFTLPNTASKQSTQKQQVTA